MPGSCTTREEKPPLTCHAQAALNKADEPLENNVYPYSSSLVHLPASSLG
ncbi:hypothetical protein ECW26_34480 [Escherichia coli W26]|nr:hypothetical protein ECW26_34480 [Escherichia coli W26]